MLADNIEVEAVETLVKESRGRVRHLNFWMIDEIGVEFSNRQNSYKATYLRNLENPRYSKEA